MLPEQEHLLKEQANTRPPGYGITFLVKSDQLEAGELLQKLKEVWRVVASWGRWCDEDLGEWPSREQCLASLPGSSAPFKDQDCTRSSLPVLTSHW